MTKPDRRWKRKAMRWEDDEEARSRLVLEEPVTEGWEIVEMDERLYSAFVAVGYRDRQFLLDVLEALATPDATTARLVVTRADIVLETTTEPVKRPRRQ